MKVDLNQEFKELDGTVMRDRLWDEDEYGQPKKDEDGNILFKRPKWTLRRICELTLVNPAQIIDERTGRSKGRSEETNLMMYHLAQDIYSSDGIIDFEDGDVKFLKAEINRKYLSPLLIGRAFDAFGILESEKPEPQSRSQIDTEPSEKP